MIYVGRDDGAALCHFLPHEFRLEAFPDGDELHLGGDDSLTGVIQLGYSLTGLGL